MRRLLPLLIAVGVGSGPLRAQDPAAVAKAIDDGCRWLLDYVGPAPRIVGGHPSEELVLYTLIHGKVDHASAGFESILQRVLDRKLENTYPVALKAMALSELDAGKYQGEIGQCAQFLVENQLADGSWGYSEPVTLPTFSRPHVRPTSEGKTAALKRMSVVRRGAIKAGDGDNSNTQYAILGLRACEEASVTVPVATWKGALSWFKSGQDPEGGWKYAPRIQETSYPSMTEGGLGSVVICLKYGGEGRPADSPLVKKSAEWIGQHFTVTDNHVGREGNAQAFVYYHLYAMERAGRIAGMTFFGQHDWYSEGATYLLDQQSQGPEAGSWEGPGNHHDRIWDTCFAVLFLSRATHAVFTK